MKVIPVRKLYMIKCCNTHQKNSHNLPSASNIQANYDRGQRYKCWDNAKENLLFFKNIKTVNFFAEYSYNYYCYYYYHYYYFHFLFNWSYSTAGQGIRFLWTTYPPYAQSCQINKG